MPARRSLLALAAVTVACSTSRSPTPSQSTGQTTGRDLDLGTSVTPDFRGASPLETGRTEPKTSRPAVSRRSPPATRLTAAIEAPVPKLAQASAATPAIREIAPTFQPAPEPVEQVFAGPMPAGDRNQPTLSVGGGLQRGGSGDGGWAPPRRPGVIIRGGLGGIDDDCDERPRFRGPIAIHSLAPRFPRGGLH